MVHIIHVTPNTDANTACTMKLHKQISNVIFVEYTAYVYFNLYEFAHTTKMCSIV